MNFQDKFLEKCFQNIRINQVEPHIPDDCQLLDIGCGGDYTLLKKVKNRIMKGIGIDADIKEKTEDNLQLMKYIIRKELPFPDEYFNCIVAMAIFEHLMFPDALLDECQRVLKPKGLLLITLPNKSVDWLVALLQKLRLLFSTKGTFQEHLHHFTYEEFDLMLRKSGFLFQDKFFQLGSNRLIIAVRLDKWKKGFN